MEDPSLALRFFAVLEIQQRQTQKQLINTRVSATVMKKGLDRRGEQPADLRIDCKNSCQVAKLNVNLHEEGMFKVKRVFPFLISFLIAL